MVWYSHLMKNFPHFVVIHTIKSFSIVNEIEVDAFLESPSFFCDPTDVGSLISGPSCMSVQLVNPLVHLTVLGSSANED